MSSLQACALGIRRALTLALPTASVRIVMEVEPDCCIECRSTVPCRWSWRVVRPGGELTGSARSLRRAIAAGNAVLAAPAAHALTPPTTPGLIPAAKLTRTLASPPRRFLMRLSAVTRRLRLPRVTMSIRWTRAVCIVCRPGLPGTGYRWSVREPRVTGSAASFNEAMQAACAVADALAIPARQAQELASIAEGVRERGDDELAARLHVLSESLREHGYVRAQT